MLDWKRVSVLGLFLAAIVALAAIGRERLAELLAAGLLGSLAPGLIGTVKGTAERADKVLTVGLAAGLVAALAAMSCAAAPPARSSSTAPSVCASGPCYSAEKCERTRAKYRAWGSVSYGAAAISGGGALTTAFPDSEDTRIGLGVTSAVVAIVAAVAVHLRDDYAAELSGFCPRGP